MHARTQKGSHIHTRFKLKNCDFLGTISNIPIFLPEFDVKVIN